MVCRGNRNRAVGRTNFNAHSSRSHAIVTIEVESQGTSGSAHSTCGKLNIVDLAGSERLARNDGSVTATEASAAAEAQVLLAETQAINLSLTALSA